MSPTELAKSASAAGFSAVAMTDSANLCGAVEFTKACKKEGIKPIYGAEVWISPTPESKSDNSGPVTLFSDQITEEELEVKYVDQGHRVVILAKDADGYRNLCELISEAWHQFHYAPRVTFEQLEAHTNGLIVITGGPCSAPCMLKAARRDKALRRLRRIFKSDFYLEVFDHGLDKHEVANKKVRAQAKKLNIPLIATNAAAYTEAGRTVSLNLLRSIATGHPLGKSPYTVKSDQAWVKTEEEMEALFSKEELQRAEDIASQCNFELDTPMDRGIFYLPESNPPPEAKTLEEQWRWLWDELPPPASFNADEPVAVPDIPEGWSLSSVYMAWYARRGLDVRIKEFESTLDFGTTEEYQARLEMEISIIIEMKFPTYMLIVAEFINWSKDNDIPVGPGRGSAAGSLVAWSMRITDVNPLQFNLMFERFLNPARKSMPDIDVDFPRVGREDVIAHVRERYGEDKVGQILTIGTFGAKAALADTARACRVNFTERMVWSKWFDDITTLEDGLKEHQIKTMYDGSNLFHNVMDLAASIEGMPRQTGVHAAGVIISSRPLSSFAPIHFDAAEGRSMVGAEMKSAEKLGMVKFDFLGLKTLDILKEACNNIEHRTGTRPDLNAIPLHDENVFQLLSKGDGLGLFQVESHGMRDLMRKMKPSHIEDVVALLALYRPGPLMSGMVDQFVECKHGRMEIQYPHPLLEEILKPTYGMIVYQEQVMGAAQILAGYSLADADLLRRAMGKKIASVMAQQKDRFIDGAKKNGIEERKAAEIFELIDKFSGYGFNKSHSAAYGLITWMTAYLKTYHRAEMMAAVMSWEQANREKLASYIFDCLQADIEILGPDINESVERFSVVDIGEKQAIRFGLIAVKGLGGAALEALVAERAKGPYVSIDDFLRRKNPKVNKKVTESLASAGAFDCFGFERHEVFLKLKPPEKVKRGAISTNQLGFFAAPAPKEDTNPRTLQDADEAKKKDFTKPWSFSEQLEREWAVLGFWISGHPLDRHADVEGPQRSHTTMSVTDGKKGRHIQLVGIVSRIHRIKTKNNDHMTFVTITDRVGQIEVVLFPKVYARFKKFIVVGTPVIVQGRLDRDGSEGKVIIDDISDLRAFRENQATVIDIILPHGEYDEKTLTQIVGVFNEHPGEIPIRFIVESTTEQTYRPVHQDTAKGYQMPKEVRYRVQPRQEFFDDIEAVTRRPSSVHARCNFNLKTGTGTR